MSTRPQPVLSVVIPAYNEAASLPHIYALLKPVLEGLNLTYEIIFVNDGSTDGSAAVLVDLHASDKAVHILTLSRNFGKELAVTAGLHRARGQAILTLDADGQFPVDRIPAFVEAWRDGAKVVVGRRSGRQVGFTKRLYTAFFYGVFRRVTGLHIDADLTDFRLIDQEVQAQFNRMTEHSRITRGLIDWLGYDRAYIPYAENSRQHGTATYSFRKLCRLALDSTISLSVSPLYITAYIGAIVLPLATLLGLGMLVDWVSGDPLHLHATGGAYLTVFILWLVGILLVSQGIIGLYLSHIHTEAQDRPLYVVDETYSKGWL
jgi:glycosyltransferase involved in cell wall biosynthesis